MKDKVSVPAEKSSPGPAPGQVRSSRTVGGKCRRRFALAAATLGVLVLGAWLAREPMTARMESVLIRHLHEQGVYPRYTQRSWLPWRGFRFDNVILHRDAAENHPVVELSELTVVFPWREMLRSRGVISRWRTKDAHLILHDDAGTIAFDHFTISILVHGQQLEIPKLEFRQNPVSWSLSGTILRDYSAETPGPPGAFSVDLTTVRAVLARLDFRLDHGQFAIRGTFFMDFRPESAAWQASLSAKGQAVEWQGIPFRDATLLALLSANGIQMTSDLHLTNGSAKVTVARTDWDRSPVIITGQLADLAGHADSFAARFDHATGGMVISTLNGPVNLLEFCRNFPALIPYVPVGLHLRTFPQIALKDVKWSPGVPSAGWSLGSIQVRSPADLTLTIAGRSLTVAGLQGQASSTDQSWKVQATTGRLSWGDFTARETKVDGDFISGKTKVESRLSLAKGTINLAVSREAASAAPYTVNGTLADSAGLVDRFTGRYEVGSQSAVVTQLEGKAHLLELASNFRATAALLPEGWQIRTFPDLVVKDFSYQMGRKTENWTLGSLQLRSPADLSVTFKGRPLAIGELTGTGAFDGKAWRLAKVTGRIMGGRLAFDGLYEAGLLRQSTLKLTKLRLEELGPWIDASPATLGNGLLSLDYRGTLGADAAQLTGSGSVQVENVPLVKVPLLDETYTLFSTFLPEVKRSGQGGLKATFSAAGGVFTTSDFVAEGDSISVTAKGKIDLVRREVSAHAWGNLRGVVGLATLAVSRTLEMQISGPLDQIRIQPVGGVRAVGKTITGATKLLETGVTAPFKVFDWLKKETPKR